MSILIQLHPEVSQGVWALIVVRDFFDPIHAVHFRIKPDVNDVIGSILPVQMSRGTTRGSVGVRGGQVVFQLPEQVGFSKLFWPEVGAVRHRGQRSQIVLIVERDEGEKQGSDHGVQSRNETARSLEIPAAVEEEHAVWAFGIRGEPSKDRENPLRRLGFRQPSTDCRRRLRIGCIS